MTVSEVMLGEHSTLSGDIVFPISYGWNAEFTAQGIPPDPGSDITLTLLGTALKGRVDTSASPFLRTNVRIFGGRNNLSVMVEDRDYKSHSIKDLIADILTDAGETVGDLSLLADIQVGHWLRLNEPASRALKRIHKYIPPDIVLRVDDSGAWNTVQLDWSNVIAEIEQRDIVDENPTDDTLVLIPTDGKLRPGVSISVRGVNRKIDKVQYMIGSKLRVMLWFRDYVRDGTEDARVVRWDPNSEESKSILSEK